MRIMTRLFVAVLSVLCVTGCSEKGTRLNAQELAALVADGVRISWQGYGFSGSARIHPDGRAHLIVPGRGEDRGEWWLKGDLVCSKWRRVRRGETLCATVGVFPDGSYELRSPKQSFQWGTFVVDDV